MPKVKKAISILKNDGPLSLSIRTLQKIEKRQKRKARSKKKFKVGSLVKYSDAINNPWPNALYKPDKAKKAPPYVINWIMSPMGRGSGGHQNILRFISYLEKAGHTCNIYLYTSAAEKPTLKAIKEIIHEAYPELKAKIAWYQNITEKADIIFATGWETAYPVLADKNNARKFYFIQDFEPYFYPVGSDNILAENSYKFNFFGVTAGKWLTKKLSTEYGMNCEYYNFGADSQRYKYIESGKRKEVFFYARPVTARRGFELGIMALDIFHKQNPDYTITLAGWDVSDYDLPFPYKNLKTLSLDELPEVYNKCAAALVISLTNMSLLPLELLACGTIPVVNNGENNRLVSDNSHIEYAEPSPAALAAALNRVVNKRNLPEYAESASRSVQAQNWDKSGKRFNEIIVKEMNG